jgi:hypothetical protein
MSELRGDFLNNAWEHENNTAERNARLRANIAALPEELRKQREAVLNKPSNQ